VEAVHHIVYSRGAVLRGEPLNLEIMVVMPVDCIAPQRKNETYIDLFEVFAEKTYGANAIKGGAGEGTTALVQNGPVGWRGAQALWEHQQPEHGDSGQSEITTFDPSHRHAP
jgi:hypothetical protein